MGERERIPEIGEVFAKSQSAYQDWPVIAIERSSIDGLVYVRLHNRLMGEKSVSAVELLRRGSDWRRKAAVADEAS